MSRIANVEIQYHSNLDAMRQEWDALIAYAESHQPTLNGVPLAQSMSPEGQKTATTFGGLQSVAAQATQAASYVPPFMAQQFPAAAQQPASIPISSTPRPFPGVQYYGVDTDTPPPPKPRTPAFTNLSGDRFAFGGAPIGISGIAQASEQGQQARPLKVEFANNDPVAKAIGQSVGVNAASPEAPPGMVRMYHGGAQDGNGPRWFSPDLKYAQGYASKTAGGGVSYLDLPENSPYLTKSFDDTGTGTKAPYNSFEAPPELAAKRRPLGEAQRAATRSKRLAGEDVSRVFGEDIEGETGPPRLRVNARHRLPTGVFGGETNAYLSSGEASPEHEAFARRVLDQRLSGGEAGASDAADFGSLRGIRRILGGQGFRGLGRFAGPFAITSLTTQYLNQQNQSNIALAGATSAQDVVGAGIAYQQASPLANIPIVGALGSAIREARTGDLAYIAGTQAGTGISNETISVRQQTLANRLAAQAAVASAGGDFAGQRQAITIGSQASVNQLTAANTQRVTDLSQAIAAITDGGQRNQLPVEQANNVLAMQREIAALNRQTQQYTASQAPVVAAQTAAVNRAERADIIRSGFAVQNFGLSLTDERAAARQNILAQYEPEIGSTTDTGRIARLRTEESAAIGAQSLGFYRTDYFAGRELQVGSANLTARQLSNQNFEFTSRYAGINTQTQAAQLQFQKETAGVPQGTVQFDQAVARLSQALAGLASDAIKTGHDLTEAGRAITSDTAARRSRLSGDFLGAANQETNEAFRVRLDRNRDPQLRGPILAAQQQALAENLDAENRRNAPLDTAFAAGGARLAGNNLAGQLQQIRGDFYGSLGLTGRDDPNFAERTSTPQGSRLLRNEQQQEQQAQLDNARRQAEVGLGTRAINQSTARQLLINDLSPLAARQQGIVDEVTNAIVKTGIDLPGTENKTIRENRIAALRGSGEAQLHQLDRDLQYSGRAVTADSIYSIGGDPNNIAYRDVTRARNIERRALGLPTGEKVDPGIANIRGLANWADPARVQKAEAFYAQQHGMSIESVQGMVAGSVNAFQTAADEAKNNPLNKTGSGGFTQQQIQLMLDYLRDISQGGARAS